MSTLHRKSSGPRELVTAVMTALLLGFGTTPRAAWAKSKHPAPQHARPASPTQHHPPAPPPPAHPWEATSPHLTSQGQADSVAAQAGRKGLRTIIQVIGRNNIEVEYANGFATRPPAQAVCAHVKADGLACITEQEFHGVPKAWNQSKDPASATTTTTSTTTRTTTPTTSTTTSGTTPTTSAATSSTPTAATTTTTAAVANPAPSSALA